VTASVAKVKGPRDSNGSGRETDEEQQGGSRVAMTMEVDPPQQV